jgi:[acyl-carrier-protein] S-malonyltransferase
MFVPPAVATVAGRQSTSKLQREKQARKMAEGGKVAFVFPGQGSQSVGMGRDLYSSYSAAKEVFDEADAAVGFPISRLCFEGPEEELVKTNNVQPAVLVTSLACLRAVHECSDNLPLPSFVAGHSLGEYTALVAAGALSLVDAVLLVRERGRLMYEAGLRNPGGMLAIIGLDTETVEEICFQGGTDISNINCPGQIVISGSVEALAKVRTLAKTKGARGLVPLKVTGAFHSYLMEPVITEFSETISEFAFHPPSIPIMSNVFGQPLNDVDSIKEELVRQLRCCIQWQRCVEYMTDHGVTTFYEIGPGMVLSNLIKRISPEAKTLNVASVDSVVQLTSLTASN